MVTAISILWIRLHSQESKCPHAIGQNFHSPFLSSSTYLKLLSSRAANFLGSNEIVSLFFFVSSLNLFRCTTGKKPHTLRRGTDSTLVDGWCDTKGEWWSETKDNFGALTSRKDKCQLYDNGYWLGGQIPLPCLWYCTLVTRRLLFSCVALTLVRVHVFFFFF